MNVSTSMSVISFYVATSVKFLKTANIFSVIFLGFVPFCSFLVSFLRFVAFFRLCPSVRSFFLPFVFFFAPLVPFSPLSFFLWVKGNGISDSVDNRLRQKASVGIQEGKHGFWLDLYRTPRQLIGHRVFVSNVTSKSQELRDLSRTQGPLGCPRVTYVTDILARA